MCNEKEENKVNVFLFCFIIPNIIYGEVGVSTFSKISLGDNDTLENTVL